MACEIFEDFLHCDDPRVLHLRLYIWMDMRIRSRAKLSGNASHLRGRLLSWTSSADSPLSTS
jgi:hypothetical protein